MQRRLILLSLLVILIAAAFLLPDADQAHGTLWSVVPPAIAIGLALIFRDVLVSLFLGVWLGSSILAGGNPIAGFFWVVDTEVRHALVDPEHVSIIVFSMMLGGMVGVMSRCGGTHGVVRLLGGLANGPRGAQVSTWLMGVCIFFDDYSNTLIVGNAMRPVTDHHRVSREKLAFLVDSTAAPVACVALVSTWIGYQLSLLGDALTSQGSSLNPFEVFVASIPYAFYPFFALTLTLTVALSRRDWGPMLAAERRARGGEIISADAQPLADYESSGLAPDPDTPQRWYNAALPVLAVIVATLVGLYVTGVRDLAADGRSTADLKSIISASDPFTVLLWASLVGLVLAIGLAVLQGILTLRTALGATVDGFKSMLMAFVVLTFAWSLGHVCEELAAAEFLKAVVGEYLPAGMIPAAVFCCAAAASFATGTSWGTIAVLTPLAVPLILGAADEASLGTLLPATVSAILGGSVFGDHCSPISDTTILSSMASACDHVDHVRTQMPYALLAAVAALFVGYLPSATGVTPLLLLPVGFALLVGWMFVVGRRAEPYPPT